MNSYLQFGYGMMGIAEELIKSKVANGVILSPRDLEPKQIEKIADSIFEAGEVLFDPQCFARDSDHKRLLSHKYWQIYKGTSTTQILGTASAVSVVAELAKIALRINSRKQILPGVLANPVSEAWFTFQERMIEAGNKVFGNSVFADTETFATIALSADVMKEEHQIEAIVERASKWNVDGVYIVPQAPSYLVDNPNWLGNLMILASGLKLLKKTVIVGYCNHQMLALASANVDFIASGTWLNVRSFDPNKFYIPDEDEQSRRTTWYYCPQTLSEFKITFLDVAQRNGLLAKMQSLSPSKYAAPLFGGAVPTTVKWKEPNAFRHYLSCLGYQVSVARKDSFDATVEFHRKTLDSAQKNLKELKSNGVLAGDRDFSDIFDSNRGALALLEKARGQLLKRNW